MKRHWRVLRQTVARPDAIQRWDRAYQNILLWNLQTQWMLKTQGSQEEIYHAGSSLRSGLDPPAGQAADD
jgi:uncharacterized protein (UPF0548 family)